MSLSSGTITFTGDIADGWGKHHANAKIRSGIHNPDRFGRYRLPNNNRNDRGR